MLGYIKLDSMAPKALENNYRRHYCFLCHALGKYYGQFSRFTVSFDVTFFLILLMNGEELSSIRKIHCLWKSTPLKEKLKEDISEKIAAFNMTLVAAELADKIDDKDTFFAKPLFFLFKRKFKKIEKKFPDMWRIIREGYLEMAACEERNATLEEIETCFAALIEHVVRHCFKIEDEQKISYLRYVAKTLYFMDAVDDLNKDIKRGAFNPLTKFETLDNLVFTHYEYLRQHIADLRKDIIPDSSDDINVVTINRIIYYGIPGRMTKICLKEGT